PVTPGCPLEGAHPTPVRREIPLVLQARGLVGPSGLDAREGSGQGLDMTAQAIDIPVGLPERLAAVKARIAAAARAVGRDAAGVTLVAVSKTHDAAAVSSAIAAGQRVF